MVSRLRFTSILFKLGDSTTSAATAKLTSSSSSSWAWPSCKQPPRTDSFRVIDDDDDDDDGDTAAYKNNVSSADDSADSCFTRSSEESLIRGLVETDRLLFEPGGDTSSILGETKVPGGGGGEGAGLKLNPFKESVVMAMASDDPYLDFKKSMEEMVVAHGMKDWERLEELLAWYLSVNGKTTHGYIVAAFVDLLVGLVASSAPAPAPDDDDDDD